MVDQVDKILIFPAPLFGFERNPKKPKVQVEDGKVTEKGEVYFWEQKSDHETPIWSKHCFKFEGKTVVPDITYGENEVPSSSYNHNATLTEKEESEIMLEYDFKANQMHYLHNLNGDSSDVKNNSFDCKECPLGSIEVKENAEKCQSNNSDPQKLFTGSSHILDNNNYFSNSSIEQNFIGQNLLENGKHLHLKYQQKSEVDSETQILDLNDIYIQKWPFKLKGSFNTSSHFISDSTAFPDRLPQVEQNHKNGTETKFTLNIPKVCDSLTNLVNCTIKDSVVNIFFVVLQVNPLQEIQIKSGINAGSFVSLSSVIGADESKSLFKVTLWREAAYWTEKMNPGDFMIATSIKIQQWRREFIGQTLSHSGFFNLHQPVKPLSSSWLRVVKQQRFNELFEWVKSTHPYLIHQMTKAKENIQFTKISDLRDEQILHFRGLLITVNIFTGSRNTFSLDARHLSKLTVVFAEAPNQEVTVCLWGKQAEWSTEFQQSIGQVWELKYLTAKIDLSSGALYLHTTPRTTRKKIQKHEKHAAEILRCFENSPSRNIQQFHSIRKLLEAKYTGLAKIFASIHSFVLHSKEMETVITTSDWEENFKKLQLLSDNFVYLGCSACTRKLEQDSNGIYGQCMYCVNQTLNYTYSSSYYYIPFHICLSDSTDIIVVHVSPQAACKLLKQTPAKVFSSCKKEETPIKDFGILLKDLLFREPQEYVFECCAILDENSFVEQRTFNLH